MIQRVGKIPKICKSLLDARKYVTVWWRSEIQNGFTRYIFVILDSSCKDSLSFCEKIKDNCNNQWVRKNCQKTCKQCHVNGRGKLVCFDRLRSCPVWKELGLCTTSRPSMYKFVQKFCYKSCSGKC